MKKGIQLVALLLTVVMSSCTGGKDKAAVKQEDEKPRVKVADVTARPVDQIQDAGTAGALAGFGQHTLAKLAGREGAGGSARGMVVRHNSPSRSHRTGLKVCS